MRVATETESSVIAWDGVRDVLLMILGMAWCLCAGDLGLPWLAAGWGAVIALTAATRLAAASTTVRTLASVLRDLYGIFFCISWAFMSQFRGAPAGEAALAIFVAIIFGWQLCLQFRASPARPFRAHEQSLEPPPKFRRSRMGCHHFRFREAPAAPFRPRSENPFALFCRCGALVRTCYHRCPKCGRGM
jgi:hypothetical protein